MSLELGTAYEPAEFETQIAGVTYKLVHYFNLNKLEKKENETLHRLSWANAGSLWVSQLLCTEIVGDLATHRGNLL